MKNSAFGVIALSALLTLRCNFDGGVLPYHSEGDWIQVRKSQGGPYFQALSFADENNGYVVGDSGRILITTDGGSSWVAPRTGSTAHLWCVAFSNPQKGWVGGESNTIGATTDGGRSWRWQNPAGEPRRTFMGMSFINEHEGWVVDNYSGILHTVDGGVSWTPQTSGTRWAITSVQFVDSREGWATATNRVVLHTLDGGNNWTVTVLDTLAYGKYVTVIYTDIFSYHSSVWIATNTMASNILNPVASVVYTSDAGKTWASQTAPETMAITSVRFVDENTGWAGSEKGILHTANGGRTWTFQLEQEGPFFVDIFFVNPSHGWALTFTGDVYRYR